MSARLERQIAELREMILELRGAVFEGKQPAPPDDEYRQAIEAMLDGNHAPMDRYLRRSGGLVPKADTIFPERGAGMSAGK